MHMDICNRLIGLARGEELTTYSDIAPLAGLSMEIEEDRERIAQLLRERPFQEDCKFKLNRGRQLRPQLLRSKLR